MTGQGVPRRPAANPLRVPGTSLKRSYAAPGEDDRVQPGDIVEWDYHRWDVEGWDSLPDQRVRGGVRITLRLARRVKGRGGQVIKAEAPMQDVVLVGRQVLLPGMPDPSGPDQTPGHAR